MDISLDSLQRMSIVIFHNVKLLKVGAFLILRVMVLDVKLNLQETDYGNFLADEVSFIIEILMFSRLLQFNLVPFANVL